MSRLIYLYSSVEVKAEEEQPEVTETNQPEKIDQTKPTHHIDHGYTVSFDSMDSASASINSDIGIQTAFPKMAPEKIENNDEKTRFCTDFPNYVTFIWSATCDFQLCGILT